MTMSGMLKRKVVVISGVGPGLGTTLAHRCARDGADLVLAAVRDAYRSAKDLQQQQMGPFAAAMQGGGLPGMPGMPGLT